ncbi:antitoxin VapB family protein [Candidatus Woesearchaeota archaeon]|nr:antitoxin VapB family protein [Candidatus Woesearchaeota archaeon]
MGTKTISIMDDAYELLVRHKKPNESFSEEIRRLVPKKGNIMECAGLWADMSDKETEEMEKTINRLRKNSTKSLFRRVEEL